MKSYFTVWPHFDWRLIFNSDRKGRYEWDRCLFFGSVYVKRLFTELFYEFCRFSDTKTAGRFKILFFRIFLSLLEPFRVIMIHFPPTWLHFNARFPFAGCSLPDGVKCLRFMRRNSTSWIGFLLLKKKTALDHWLHNHTALKRKPITYPFCLRFFFPLYLGAQTHGYPFSIMLVRNNSTNCPFFWCLKDAAIESSPLPSKIMECAYKKVEKRGEKIDKYGLTWLNCQSWWKINDRLI